jgi:AsmA protein
MKWFKIGILGCALVAVLLIVFGVPANFLVGSLQSRFEAATGDRLQLGGETTVKFWPALTISLRDVTLLTGAETASDSHFKADRINIALSFRDLVGGHQRITQLTMTRPTLRLPLPRERNAAAANPSVTSAAPQEFPVIDHIVVEDGAVAFNARSAGSESQIDHVQLDVTLPPTVDSPTVTGDLRIAGQPLHLELKAKVLPQTAGQTIPVELTLQGAALFDRALSASAELRSRNGSLAINSLSGRYGASNFDGFATVDFNANKPMVKADLDIDRLQFLPDATDRSGTDGSALSEPWSDREFNLGGLNAFNAEVRASVSELAIGTFKLAPVSLQATLDDGVVKATLNNTKLYQGTAEGTLSLDVSGAVPAHAMKVQLSGISALPMLTDAAGFQSLEGTMQANIDVTASGASERAALSSLAGTVDFHLADGAVRGIDVGKLMHNLTKTILDGWQQNPDDKTPLTDLTASFSLANGVATTTNLVLSGPIARMTGTGTIDIAGKTLDLRVDPRLAVGQQGAGSSGSGNGLGVPVVIQGNWSAPRIYPDVAGIFNDPASAFDSLKQAGKGLFGSDRQPGDTGQSGNSGGANSPLNNLLDGFFKGTHGNGGLLGNGR